MNTSTYIAEPVSEWELTPELKEIANRDPKIAIQVIGSLAETR